MTFIDWANWSNSASTTGQSKGWPGALLVAVEAGDMKRQQLSHGNSLPVLLVAAAGRLLPSVDAFPANAGGKRPAFTTLARPGTGRPGRIQAGDRQIPAAWTLLPLVSATETIPPRMCRSTGAGGNCRSYAGFVPGRPPPVAIVLLRYSK